MAVWCMFYVPFGIFVDHLVYFSRFGMLYQDKSGNPAFDRSRSQSAAVELERAKFM
jgi:hypothetical protein